MREFQRQIKQDRWVILAMLALTAAAALAVSYRWIFVVGKGDYPHHIRVTEWILARQYQDVSGSVIAHPAYQLLMLGMYFLFFQRVSFSGIALVIHVAAQISLVWIIYQWLGGTGKKAWTRVRAALAVTLTMATPIMALVVWDRLFYIGYIGLATYHNPTIQLLKPIALVSFIFAARTFGPGRSSWTFILSSASLTMLSALIKPNYLLGILPGLGLVAALYLVKGRPLDWRLLWLGFFIPGCAILTAQFVVAYYLPNTDSSSILFSPFGVVSAYSNYVVPKFLLSTLFPLTVAGFNFSRVRRDGTLLLAWAGFLASVVQMYFLAEGGSSFLHGNFFWGAQVMSLILFVASARFLWREKLATGEFPMGRDAIPMAIYAAHVLAGIAYFVSVMTLPRYA